MNLNKTPKTQINKIHLFIELWEQLDNTQKDCLIGSPENLNLKNFEKLNKPQFGASLGMMKYCAEVDNKEFTFNRSKGIIGRMLEWLRSEM